MNKFDSKILAVTGASGHLGRRTVELLLEQGAQHVVALTRAPEKLADLAARGVDVRQASFDHLEALPKAFAGVERLLIVSTDTLGLPGARRAQHVGAIAAAEAAGVQHIVYTSLTSPYPDPNSPIADDHFWTEARLFASRLDWSVLRNNQYTDYLLPGAEPAIASGTLFHAAGDGARAYVTREDCAAAAAGALLGAEGKRIFDVSGPAAVSGTDIASLFAEISGRPVIARNLPDDELVAGYVAGGVPEPMARVLARFDADTARGYLGIVTGAVEELTGHAPQSVASFLKANLKALAA